MIDLKLDATHDLALEDGDLALIDGPEQVAQSVDLSIRIWEGEWFLDRRIGIDYRGKVFGKNTHPVIRDAEIKSEILNVEEVEEFSNYTAEVTSDRGLFVDYALATNEGDVSGELNE